MHSALAQMLCEGGHRVPEANGGNKICETPGPSAVGPGLQPPLGRASVQHRLLREGQYSFSPLPETSQSTSGWEPSFSLTAPSSPGKARDHQQPGGDRLVVPGRHHRRVREARLLETAPGCGISSTTVPSNNKHELCGTCTGCYPGSCLRRCLPFPPLSLVLPSVSLSIECSN